MKPLRVACRLNVAEGSRHGFGIAGLPSPDQAGARESVNWWFVESMGNWHPNGSEKSKMWSSKRVKAISELGKTG